MDALTLGTPGQHNVYRPSFIDETMHGVPMALDTSLGVMVSNGLIPGVKNGGIIKLGDTLWGVDHVAIVGRRNQDGKDEIVILGTEKDDVAADLTKKNIGRPLAEGALIFTNLEEELVVIAGIYKNMRNDPWAKERLASRGMRVSTIGEIAIGIPAFNRSFPQRFRIHAKNDMEAIARPLGC